MSEKHEVRIHRTSKHKTREDLEMYHFMTFPVGWAHCAGPLEKYDPGDIVLYTPYEKVLLEDGEHVWGTIQPLGSDL